LGGVSKSPAGCIAGATAFPSTGTDEKTESDFLHPSTIRKSEQFSADAEQKCLIRLAQQKK
jgi:hypothetical protein